MADNAAGVVPSEHTLQSGPNETLGEACDDTVESANEAREARADASEDRVPEVREKADALEDAAERARGR